MMERGIYFNLPEADYRKADGLSFSGMKNLMISPLKYWHEAINPNKVEKETSAKTYGKAYHKMILEPDSFLDNYALLPEDAPRKPTKAQINAKKPSPDTLVAIDFWNNWKLENEGKLVVVKDEYDTLCQARSMIENYPNIAKSLTNGYSEVSFFLDFEGVRIKGRLDYITPTETIDLKTFSNALGKNIDKVVRNSIVYGGYNLQWFVYSNLREELRKLVKKSQAQIFGDVSESFRKEFLENQAIYSCVFQESEAPFEVRKITLEKSYSQGATPNMYWVEAQRSFENALITYRENKEKYGLNPWIGEDYEQTLTDEEVPNIIYQNY